MIMDHPQIIALAGPNGAGKSTFYDAHLRLLGLYFINADEIARVSGSAAYDAARVAGALREFMVHNRSSFVFETVLSDPIGEKVASLRQAMSLGYDVTMVYIGLSAWEQSAERVCLRAAQGGHDVPTEKIKERYGRNLKNLVRAMGTLSHVIVYDNSDLQNPYRLLARYENGAAAFTAGALPAWFTNVLNDAGPLDK
jgi:predicted ABC-type ATPase